MKYVVGVVGGGGGGGGFGRTPRPPPPLATGMYIYILLKTDNYVILNNISMKSILIAACRFYFAFLTYIHVYTYVNLCSLELVLKFGFSKMTLEYYIRYKSTNPLYIIYTIQTGINFLLINCRNCYYRSSEGGRLYDLDVVSGYVFLRTYHVSKNKIKIK